MMTRLQQSRSIPVVLAGIVAVAIGQVLMGPTPCRRRKRRDRMDDCGQGVRMVRSVDFLSSALIQLRR